MTLAVIMDIRMTRLAEHALLMHCSPPRLQCRGRTAPAARWRAKRQQSGLSGSGGTAPGSGAGGGGGSAPASPSVGSPLVEDTGQQGLLWVGGAAAALLT